MRTVCERYWRVAVLGLAVGAILGALLYVFLGLAGNSNRLSYLDAGELLLSIAGFAGVGLTVALFSCIGALFALLIGDRRLEKSSAGHRMLISAGAACGTLLLGGVLSVIQALTEQESSVGLTMGIAVAVAIASAIAAASMAGLADRLPAP